MYDRFNRKINYLRISVTDKCNLRCRYCMPEEGVRLLKHEDILSLEEIAEVARISIGLGIHKIRITGGEPLVRKGVVYLAKMLSGIPGIRDIAMTTNGILLEKYAEQLKEAGLKRVNISLDTTDPEKYRYITRGGDIYAVFKGIDAAHKAGLDPVKINCVVSKSSDEQDAQAVKAFCDENNLAIRFIHRMDLQTGRFTIVEGGQGGNCSLCNRLRLTANGMIKPCLFSDLEFSVREYGIERAIRMAVDAKPEYGTVSMNNCFSKIGG
ncbi:MAG: radical SAM protein [Bacteroidetes bacterium]|nr:radical SAM protein [Bacteroidota bacterium]